jgi:hypothetical protein
MLNSLGLPLILINFIHEILNTFYHRTSLVCLGMLDHGTLSLNNFIHFSWVLLIVAAVGTGISIAPAANNTCSISIRIFLGLINHDV